MTVPVILALTGFGAESLRRVYCGAAVRLIGRRSYGLYLWHFPILSLARHQTQSGIPHVVKACAGLLVSFGVAAISHRLVESSGASGVLNDFVQRLSPAPVTADPA
jgi:peptidoglycan/LPS O-acetylase OafA/YrhL